MHVGNTQSSGTAGRRSQGRAGLPAMRRAASALRALGSLLAIALVLVGIPGVIAVLAGPLLRDLTAGGWAGVLARLMRPDDGSLLAALLALLASAAWLVVASCLMVEILAVVSRQRIRIRLPGLGVPQHLAASLLLPLVALAAAPQSASAQPVVSDGRPAVTAHVRVSTAAVEASAARPSPITSVDPAPGERRHAVVTGDDLWSLAEHYYGRGESWRTIAAANPRLLSGGPDRLIVGWQLIIPDALAEAPGSSDVVSVRAGESLWAVAERALGSTARWPELFEANRAVLTDPDDIVPGMRLRIPGGSVHAQGEDRSSEDGWSPREREHGSRSSETRRVPDSSAGRRPPSERPSAPATESATPPRVPPAAPDEPARPPTESSDHSDHAPEWPADWPAVSAVGAVLAGGLIAAMAGRRRVQLQLRPVGRRVSRIPGDVRRVEAAISRRQQPLGLRALDRGARAIAAQCAADRVPLPPLEFVLLSGDAVEFVMARPSAAGVPAPFLRRDRSWVLPAAGLEGIAAVPGYADALHPWPALVTLGTDATDRLVLADLMGAGSLALRGSRGFDPGDVLEALCLELAFSAWASELDVLAVGVSGPLIAALDQPNVTTEDTLDAAIERLDRLPPASPTPRSSGPGDVPGFGQVLLIGHPIGPEHRRRLSLLRQRRRGSLAVVALAGDGGTAKPGWVLSSVVQGDPDADQAPTSGTAVRSGLAVLTPAGITLTPQCLPRQETEALVRLTGATGSAATEPAPWWEPDERGGRPPDNVTYLGKRFGGWTSNRDDRPDQEGGETTVIAPKRSDAEVQRAPLLRLLGPIDLLDAAGTPPPRAPKQCLEYCAWLLENPNSSARAMVGALFVAEGTRRSNMSRLRTWLGTSESGEPYLPDAYSGRIALDPAVSSDWQQLQILITGGVNRATDDRLVAALEMVRGAPLADAAPGQWHWAEELRMDMISCIRDIGVELGERALGRNDLAVARRAAVRALAAAPGDELLLALRIRTERAAGNVPEAERLSLQLARQARQLNVDLSPQTVATLQEVMEGQVRARFA